MRTLSAKSLALVILSLPSISAVVSPSWRVLAQVGSESISRHDIETCEVTGLLVSAVSGEAIGRAQVGVNLVRGAQPPATNTDANGRFLLHGVPIGRQRVSVRKKGYLDATFDIAACPSSQTVRNNFSQVSRFNTLRLIPLSAVSGRVTDEAGDPVVAAEVHAMLPRSPGRPLRSVATTTTDDLGMYRLHGLRPGTYYISAGPPETASAGSESTDDTVDEYQITYYPQATGLTAATPVSVQPGNSPSGVDIQLVKDRPQNRAAIVPTSISMSPPDSSLPSPDRAAQGSASPARATVIGMVVNDLTNEPVKHAKTTLEPTRNGAASYTSETDADGHFAMQVDPGNYEALVDKAGFLSAPHLNATNSQIPVSLSVKSRQILRDVVLRVSPWSVISGRVFDADGSPAQDFQVQALRYNYVNGKRQLQTVATSTTNDLGEYRLYGLSRGKYYVRSGLQGAGSQESPRAIDRYVGTYYPQSLDLESAAPVEVEKGVQVGGINLWAQLSQLFDVRGHVLSGSGTLNRDAVVALIRTSADSADVSFNASVAIDAQGHFAFSAVPPGTYTLSAVCNDKDGQYVGEQTIQVSDATVDNVDLQLNRTVTISGQLRMESGTTFTLRSARVLLEPDKALPTGPVAGDIHPDGTFSVSGVLPEQYTVELLGLPDGYYLKGTSSGSDEQPGGRIDLRHAAGSISVLVAAGSTVVGSVSDHEHQPAPGVNVVLIPALQNGQVLEGYKSVATDREGKFRIGGLAPGTYEVFAIEGIEPNTYVDPDFLASVQDYSQSVTLQDRSTENINIELISGGSE